MNWNFLTNAETSICLLIIIEKLISGTGITCKLIKNTCSDEEITVHESGIPNFWIHWMTSVNLETFLSLIHLFECSPPWHVVENYFLVKFSYYLLMCEQHSSPEWSKKFSTSCILMVHDQLSCFFIIAWWFCQKVRWWEMQFIYLSILCWNKITSLDNWNPIFM